jgi:pimeloyl-ACP methyl ester carboxylesterase
MKTVTSKDGTRIAYDETGQGPVVILILGALNSRKSGSKLAKLLAPHFTVVSYDRRGRGKSTDTPPYSPHREVEDVAALMDAVEDPVYVYGHSSGAALALQTADKLGKKVRRLAIYEAPYSLDADARRAATEYYRSLVRLLREGRKGDAVALFVQSVGVSEKQVRAMKSLPMWPGLEAMAPTLAYDGQVMGEGYALPVPLLQQIKTPTLVMHGGKGAAAMRDAARAICEAMPNAQLRTVAGETHGVRPKVLAPILEEFFA